MKLLLCLFIIGSIIGSKENHPPQIDSSIQSINYRVVNIDVLSIIQTVTGKTPKVYGITADKSKILFLDSRNEDYQETLYLVILEKLNGNWIKMNTHQIGEKYDRVGPLTDSINQIEIDEKEFMHFNTENFKMGTANNGLSANNLVYFDIENDSIIDVSYSIWSREAVGTYKIKNSTLNKHKSILKHVVGEIKQIYGEQNTNINDIENFHLKWESINNDIYTKIQKSLNSDTWIDFNALSLDRDFFFKHIEKESPDPNLKENSKYLAVAGFVNPILAYSKTKKETYVLWIPQGWPSGGAWGLRSFNIDDITGDRITASNDFVILHFDLKKMKVTAAEKL